MWKYIFSGVVLPERALINITDPFPIDIDHVSACIKGNALVTLIKNQIIIDFTSNEPISNSEYFTLKNVMTDLVSTIINCAGIEALVGYTIDLKSMISIQDQQTVVFGVDIPGLSIRNDEYAKIDILKSFKIVGKEPLLQLALSDFKDAIIYPNNTGLFCYRAIESLINIIKLKNNNTNKKNAIQELEKLLNLDESCIKFLRELNVNVRHGHVEWISGEDRQNAIRITKEIISRYLELQSNPAITFNLLNK